MLDLLKSETSTAENDGQFFEVVEKFCYLGDRIGARGGAVESVQTRVRNISGV